MSATPTPHEIEMAAYRAKVAGDNRAEIEKCVAVLGPGADAYGCWVITDKRGEVPDQVIPTCRRGNGWQPPCPNITERLTESPAAYTDKSGVTHYPFRFTHSFWSLNEYRPQTAEQLAAARERREEKEREKQREEMALFPDFNPALSFSERSIALNAAGAESGLNPTHNSPAPALGAGHRASRSMCENLELDFSHRPPQVSVDQVDAVCAYLAGKGWIKAAQIEAEIEVSERHLRRLAEKSDGRILSGQKGYRLFDEAVTPEEAAHASNWLVSQGKTMFRRGMAIRRRGYVLGVFKKPAA